MFFRTLLLHVLSFPIKVSYFYVESNSIYDISFRDNAKLGGYTTLMSDIPKYKYTQEMENKNMNENFQDLILLHLPISSIF